MWGGRVQFFESVDGFVWVFEFVVEFGVVLKCIFLNIFIIWYVFGVIESGMGILLLIDVQVGIVENEYCVLFDF